jgi:hypothetical protein
VAVSIKSFNYGSVTVVVCEAIRGRGVPVGAICVTVFRHSN